MAFAVTVTYQIVDISGDTAPTKVKVPNGFSIAQYVEFGGAMAQLIANIVEGRIASASINFRLSLSAATIRNAPLSGANVRNKAMFLFEAAVAGFSGKVRIPTYNDVYNIAGSDVLDPAEPVIDSFIQAMEDGIDIGSEVIIQPLNGREMDLTTYKGGTEQFQRKRG